MAHGLTLKLRSMATEALFREPLPDRKPVARDRSLNGKARIRARKAANKEMKERKS